MIQISSEAIESLKLALSEFEEYRPDPIVVLSLFEHRSKILLEDGRLFRRYVLGQPHAVIFPARATRGYAETERTEIGGLRFIVAPLEFRRQRIEVAIFEGELVADTAVT